MWLGKKRNQIDFQSLGGLDWMKAQLDIKLHIFGEKAVESDLRTTFVSFNHVAKHVGWNCCFSEMNCRWTEGRGSFKCGAWIAHKSRVHVDTLSFWCSKLSPCLVSHRFQDQDQEKAIWWYSDRSLYIRQWFSFQPRLEPVSAGDGVNSCNNNELTVHKIWFPLLSARSPTDISSPHPGKEQFQLWDCRA
jgi:hypothetical protein